MEYPHLGRSGFKVPVLSLGTGTFGGGNEFFKSWGDTDAKGAANLIDVCLYAGMNFFDSADIYSNDLAEEVLGAANKGRRDKVFISTKATFRFGDGPNNVGSSWYHLIESCEAQLTRLGTDTIDLYQMHGFDAVTPVEETLSVMNDHVKAGKVRYIGCSNFSGWHLMKSLAVSEKHGRPQVVGQAPELRLEGEDPRLVPRDDGVTVKAHRAVWRSRDAGIPDRPASCTVTPTAWGLMFTFDTRHGANNLIGSPCDLA